MYHGAVALGDASLGGLLIQTETSGGAVTTG